MTTGGDAEPSWAVAGSMFSVLCSLRAGSMSGCGAGAMRCRLCAGEGEDGGGVGECCLPLPFLE